MTDQSPAIIDLDIRIFKAGDTYTVTAQAPGTGLAQNELDTAALFDTALQEQLAQIREEPFTTDEALFRQVGETLFKALFRDQVWDLFYSLWMQRSREDEEASLRLRLNISEAAVELAVLPWEMMQWQDVFLATQIDTLVTRQLLNLDYGNIKTLQVKGTPRTLIVIPGGSGLETDVEEAAIVASLEKAGIPYDLLKGQVPLQLLDDTLAEGNHAILHFIGHATFEVDDSGKMRGSLRFNAPKEETTPEENEDWVPETDLQAMLGNHKRLKLVVLNACHTGEISQRPDAARGFWGVIPALLRAGVPAVVAMQYAIRDDVAATFAETFYKRLCTGKWAGHVDFAVTLARNSCFLAFPDDRGFATPVLYLRTPDGVIFQLTDQLESSAPDTPETTCEEAPEPPAQLRYRYRNLNLETLIARPPQLQSRLQRLLFQIDELRTRSDLNEKQTWRLHRYEKNRDELEREVDELRDVLAWRLYEACLELQKLEKRVAQKQQEKEVLEKAGAYISYELKSDIFKMNERILALRELLQAGEAVLAEGQ